MAAATPALPRNTTPWPTVENLAPFLINATNEKRRMFVSSDVFATEKLDGTNLGIDWHGALLSRRTLIPPTDTAFQLTPLAILRDALLCSAVSRAAKNIERVSTCAFLNCVFYGEFGVNANAEKYEYRELGFGGGAWKCFGAVVVVDSEETAKLCRVALAADGFWIVTHTAHSNPLHLVLVPCPRFFLLLQKYFIQHVTVIFEGSLHELLVVKEQWMKRHTSEGLVISMKTNPPMESFQLPSVAIEKWKQGHENQGNVPRNLIALLAASRAPSTPQNQHPPRISLDLVPIFKLLLVVSQHSILLPNDSNASTLLLRTSPPGTTVVSGIKGPAMYNSSPVPLKSIIKNVGGLVGRVENGHSLKRTHELKRVTFNDFTLNPEKRQRTLFPSSITSSFASSSSSSSSFSSSKLTFSRSSSHSFSASSSSNSISPSYHHMILSACTKYDHDSVYFARDEKDLYKGLIVQEVFEDGYADQDVAGTFNERTAEFAVGLYVEQRFAKWKKV